MRVGLGKLWTRWRNEEEDLADLPHFSLIDYGCTTIGIACFVPILSLRTPEVLGRDESNAPYFCEGKPL